jgi:hypothetical protein
MRAKHFYGENHIPASRGRQAAGPPGREIPAFAQKKAPQVKTCGAK